MKIIKEFENGKRILAGEGNLWQKGSLKRVYFKVKDIELYADLNDQAIYRKEDKKLVAPLNKWCEDKNGNKYRFIVEEETVLNKKTKINSKTAEAIVSNFIKVLERPHLYKVDYIKARISEAKALLNAEVPEELKTLYDGVEDAAVEHAKEILQRPQIQKIILKATQLFQNEIEIAELIGRL